jgi:hypothetical protein
LAVKKFHTVSTEPEPDRLKAQLDMHKDQILSGDQDSEIKDTGAGRRADFEALSTSIWPRASPEALLVRNLISTMLDILSISVGWHEG